MDEVRLTYNEAFLYAMIPVLIGFLLGLIPLIVGIVHKKTKLGFIGLLVSTLGGAFFGMLLSIPAMAVFTWLILRDRVVPANEHAAENSGDEEKPAN